MNLCKSLGERVSRDLLPTAPPPVAASGEVVMTCEEHMCALGCMMRAMVMHHVLRGAGLAGATGFAAARRMIAAMMKRDAAVRAPFYPFFFSDHARAGCVVPSSDRLVVKQRHDEWHWARSEQGVGAGCGVVRWVQQLSHDSAGMAFKIGVASDAFSEYYEARPDHSWFFLDYGIFIGG